MRIQKIHLFNFRSVEDLTLDISADGLHALIGSFGSGKSSFLTGIRFALFGDNGEAGSNPDLRRRGCPEGEEAGCEVTFTQGQDIYVARRWLRRSVTKARGISEKAHASLTINGQPVEGMTTNALTREMEEVIGMGAKAFTSASLIPQGEVATLMKSTPTEVQALIEKHTGLDALTKRRDLARKAAGELESTAEALPGDAETVWDKEQQLVDAEEELKIATEALATVKAQHEALSTVVQEADTHARSLREQERRAADHATLIATTASRVDAAQQAVNQLHEEARDAGVDLQRSVADDAQVLTDLDTQLEQVATTGRDLVEAGKRTATAQENAQEAQEISKQATARISGLTAEEQELNAREQQEHEQVAQVETAISTHLADHSAAKADYNRLTRSLDSLRSTDSDGHQCPTCYQQVEDYQRLITDLEQARTSAQQRMEQAIEHGTQARTLQQTAKENLQQIATAREHIAHQCREIGNTQREAQRIVDLVAQAAQQEQQARDHVKTVVAGYGRDTDGGDEALLAHGRGIHSELQKKRDKLVAASGLRHRLTQAQTALTAAIAASEQAANTRVEAPSADSIAQAEAHARTLREDADAAAQEFRDATAAHASAKSGHGITAAMVDMARGEWANKVQARNKARVARGEAEVLSALRSDLLADFTRSICRSASDLLAGFGGEYVAFRMGEDFVPRAELADGTLVSTKLLSGGESAMVGLAFRIGVTLHITGGGLPEQILGDEITNYLDEEGRRAVLAALNSIFPSILLISHTAEAEDYATTVHRVERSELQPTQWVEEEVNIAS